MTTVIKKWLGAVPHCWICCLLFVQKLFTYNDDDDDRGKWCCVGEISNVTSLKVKSMT